MTFSAAFSSNPQIDDRLESIFGDVAELRRLDFIIELSISVIGRITSLVVEEVRRP